VFGPRNTTDWSKSMPKKMRRKALCGALTLKAKDGAVVAVDKLVFATPKTAEAAKVFAFTQKCSIYCECIRSFRINVYVINYYSLMTFKQILQKRAKRSTQGKMLWKLSPYQILGKPMITEKAYKMVEDQNIYTFRVHRDANKNDVNQSLQAIYNVTPKSVRVMTVRSKWRMYRKLVRRSYKKAYVSLKKWESIELAA